MLETFLIGGLSVVIPLLLFWTIGGKNTLYVFIGVCVLGLLIGIFEDINFSSSGDLRKTNAYKSIEPCSNPSDLGWTEVSVYGKSYSVIPESLYRTGTEADTRTVSVEDDKYRLPKDAVCRCSVYEAIEYKYGYSVDPSTSVKGNVISGEYNGSKYEAKLPVDKGERCIVYAEMQNTIDGLYKYGRPHDTTNN